ncbi:MULTISPECIES: hypothetical protein [Pseudomonas]|jgi:hypothetical protein|uniref:hypothetical protein n=1 Tax=Pseudomonas TaxID=286 RepID=UPI001E2A0B55|nr:MULTISPECIES: hypothetical protein [Pseudomonas]MCE1117784.1 hypothetical protein [Pseudomonas sp. NMI795_08]
MNIHVECNTEQNRWWVRMDDWRVGFNTAAEAEQFVERLNARLNAPHSLAMLADRSPRPGVTARADLRCAKEA